MAAVLAVCCVDSGLFRLICGGGCFVGVSISSGAGVDKQKSRQRVVYVWGGRIEQRAPFP